MSPSSSKRGPDRKLENAHVHTLLCWGAIDRARHDCPAGRRKALEAWVRGSGLLPALGCCFLLAYVVFAIITSPGRQQVSNKCSPAERIRTPVRVLAWLIMTAIALYTGVSLDLAATDHAPGMSTAAIAVVTAPAMTFLVVVLTYLAAISLWPQR